MSNAFALVGNLLMGVLVAHSLGPSGRGELTAVSNGPQIAAWLFAVASVQTISYFEAKDPTRGARLLSTSVLLASGLAVIATAVGELCLPTLLASQSSHALDVARVAMLAVVVFMLSEVGTGFVLGDHRFRLFNGLRLSGPMLVAAIYAVLEAVGRMTLVTALVGLIGVHLLGVVVTLTCSVRRHGVVPPSASLARETMWYGLRAHGARIGFLSNARLDLLIAPAFLTASSVGLYSVATNISWILLALSTPLSLIALPLAVREQDGGGGETIIRLLHVTLLIAVSLAVVLGLTASLGVRMLYGDQFLGSVTALRLLLPGSVLYAAALVLISGLYSVERPFTAAAAQALGLSVTVVGLLLFLRSGGIDAAAVISTVSYTLVFLLALILYQRATGLTWAAFLPRRASNRSHPKPTAIDLDTAPSDT